jgi:hypothetical protein
MEDTHNNSVPRNARGVTVDLKETLMNRAGTAVYRCNWHAVCKTTFSPASSCFELCAIDAQLQHVVTLRIPPIFAWQCSSFCSLCAQGVDKLPSWVSFLPDACNQITADKEDANRINLPSFAFSLLCADLVTLGNYVWLSNIAFPATVD